MSSHSLLISNLNAQEGCIPHMYLDTRGYVTVAVGQLLAHVADAQNYRLFIATMVSLQPQRPLLQNMKI